MTRVADFEIIVLQAAWYISPGHVRRFSENPQNAQSERHFNPAPDSIVAEDLSARSRHDESGTVKRGTFDSADRQVRQARARE